MQSDELELDLPPVFDIGTKVKTRKLIRNDAHILGKKLAQLLLRKEKLAMSSVLVRFCKIPISMRCILSKKVSLLVVAKKNSKLLRKSNESYATSECCGTFSRLCC